MGYFCPNCGKEGYVPGYYCSGCGYKQPTPEEKINTGAASVSPEAAPQAITQEKKAKKQKKEKKKGGCKRFLKKFAIFIAINLVLIFLWFAFGNMITLSIYTKDVAETISSGSLDLEDSVNSSYSQLPQYVQNMVEKPNSNNGPVVDAMLPYLDAKRVKVNGFFGENTVIYEITAPDMESYIKNLDGDTVASRDQLLSMLTEYAGTAPRTSRKVEITYHRRGLFSWYGNYDTPEFLDAVTGGLNTAYTELYREMMKEFEEAMKQ